MVFTAIPGFPKEERPSVVVIGAGLAGLTTAYRLQQKGFEVHVYEARGRVGGRVFSVNLGNRVGELGGQNITDGGEAENLRRLIDEFQFELTETPVNLNHSYFNGKVFTPSQLLFKNQFDIETIQSRLSDVVQKSRNMRDVLDGLLEEKDPLYKTLSVRLAGYEGGSIEKLSTLYAKTLYYMLRGGVSSVHQAADDEGHCIHLVSIKGGNALLPEELARSLGDRVHLNMPLVAVSKNSSYELLFQNGDKVQADILVLAIPCSVYEDIAFSGNAIPEERLRAIQSVQYGTNAKILVPFPQSPQERKTFINDRIVSFFDAKREILTLYYTGEAARFSQETIAKAYLDERPMLEIGFGDLCPPLSSPQCAQDRAFASYEGPLGYSWPNDRYAKGSYSYIAAGQESLLTATQTEGEEEVKTLFAPIDGTLYFAGEHASILKEVPGTMEAACESGERTARMILTK